jgi:hypothetical protein
VVYRQQAWAITNALSASYGRLLERAIAFIKHGPADGIPVANDEQDGTVMRQISVHDRHVQYTVKYWPIGRALLMITIEIRPWEPLDDTPTVGTPDPKRC